MDIDDEDIAGNPAAAGYTEAIGLNETGVQVLLDLLVVMAAQTAGHGPPAVQVAHQVTQAARSAVIAVAHVIGGRDPTGPLRWAREPIRRANQQLQAALNRSRGARTHQALHTHTGETDG